MPYHVALFVLLSVAGGPAAGPAPGGRPGPEGAAALVDLFGPLREWWAAWRRGAELDARPTTRPTPRQPLRLKVIERYPGEAAEDLRAPGRVRRGAGQGGKTPPGAPAQPGAPGPEGQPGSGGGGKD